VQARRSGEQQSQARQSREGPAQERRQAQRLEPQAPRAPVPACRPGRWPVPVRLAARPGRARQVLRAPAQVLRAAARRRGRRRPAPRC
jgi:hypothetical protein